MRRRGGIFMGWFFFIITLALVVSGVLYWRWREKIKAEIAEGSAIDWAFYQENEPEFLDSLSETQFREIYARVHTPRFPGYALAAITTFFASLPVTFGALTAILWLAQKMGLTPESTEIANRLFLDNGEVRFFKRTPPEAALYYVEDLAGFYYFFGVLIVWLLIVAFFMRRYHARRPGYLRDEVIRSRKPS